MASSLEKVKKRSMSLDCETRKSHSTRTKKKKDRETVTRRTHSSKKDKHARAHPSSSRHKIRNISELAKLVSSGRVKVPQSLENYADDKLILLDQLFTILTPDDIRGMLPDILKGLKTKQVKRLCYEQLQKMDTELIKRIIFGEVDHRKIESELNEETDLTADLETLSKEVVGTETSGEGSTSGQCQSESATIGQQTYDPHVSDGAKSEGDDNTSTATLQKDVKTKSPMQTQTVSTDVIEYECEYENIKELCDSEKEDELDDKQSSWSPEPSEAKEILLRQKCLEAALLKKRATITTCENEKTTVEDKDESLEERLRQRALESLLNRHKN